MAPKKTWRTLRKLVRDKIPEEIASEGQSVRGLEVPGNLKDFLLRRKAFEEVLELCNAQGLDSLKEELADVLEVLHALAAEHRIPLDDVERIRVAKRVARGGFDKGVFIDYVAPRKPNPQIGLFGPMDYVSVTKRTPRTNEIKMHDESLLRIPLVPSLSGEEFKVGNYTVTYTNREILVRIHTETDDKQTLLFQPEPGFYDLGQSPEKLVELLPKFEGFWKIYSNILLKASGFSIPNSVILQDLTTESQDALRQFCQGQKYSHLLVRHDRNPELMRPPRGGYLIKATDVCSELTPFFAQGRLLMLQEPLSPYNDLYSCSAILRKNSAEAHLEIVGPGFDASDLNRGDITPHETWTVVCDPAGELNISSARRNLLVETPIYRQSVRRRLAKIGMRASGAFSIGKRRDAKGKTEEQLVTLAKRALRKNRDGLLLEHLEEYCPLGEERIVRFAQVLHQLSHHWNSELFLWRDEIVVSMSLLPSGRLVLWQIVWPERKSYEV